MEVELRGLACFLVPLKVGACEGGPISVLLKKQRLRVEQVPDIDLEGQDERQETGTTGLREPGFAQTEQGRTALHSAMGKGRQDQIGAGRVGGRGGAACEGQRGHVC